MLDTVIEAVIGALQDNGVNAVRQFPKSRADAHGEPVVTVGVKSSKITGSGCGDYLGTEERDGGLDAVELYGFRLEVEVALNIYSPPETGAGAADRIFEQVSSLMNGLPSGLRAASVSRSETAPDKTTGLFLCPAKLALLAFIVAEKDEDADVFLDFKLKGVLSGSADIAAP